MAIDNDLLTFDPQFGITSNEPVVRDDETVLVTCKRSRSGETYRIRGYNIEGDGIKLSAESRGQADLATIFVELFDGDDLADSGNTWYPVRPGIPVAVAADGKPAIAAWLEVRGRDREEIAELLDVGERTVVEYLTRFRSRGDGLPDVEPPKVGETMPELPPRFDPQRHAVAADGGNDAV